MTWYNRKTMLPQTSVVDDFWTHDIPLFDGVFRYYHRQPGPVRGKIHLAEERYFEKHEIIPMTTSKGMQTYVMLYPYVFEPKLILTIGLYKKPKLFADQEPALGETVGSAKQAGIRERQIGEAQAWYYHEDNILVLWECFLWEFVRDHSLARDPQMKQLWQGFETWLVKQFPKAIQIVMPFDDPLFAREEYQTFLRSLGYESVAKAAFGKKLT